MASTSALVAGLASVAPQALASASSGAPPSPVYCQGTSQDTDYQGTGGNVTFSGTGTLTCTAAGTGQVLSGTDTFSGTMTGLQCNGDDKSGTYQATVTWSDGTKTSGTLTNFHEDSLNGSELITISGTNDASSTRFAGYTAYVTTISTGSCGTSGGPVTKEQTGYLTYVPPA
jgi:hypothetical protein